MKPQALLIFLLIVFLASNATSLADSAKDEAVKKDLQLFQGTWGVVSMEMDGKLLSEEARKKTKVTIKGENFTFQNAGGQHKGLYKIDPTKNPKELDIVITEGGEKGKVYLTIYKFEDGKMIHGQVLSNARRPNEFTGKAGSGCALEIWQRESP